LGVLILAFPSLGAATLLVLLSIGLFFVGIRSISIIGFNRIPDGLRVASAVAGIISLILALFVMLFPGYGVLTLIIIVSFGLIVYGLTRLFVAYSFKMMVSWLRGLIAGVGALDIILSVAVLALPSLALLTLAAILSLVLLISGAEMLISGAIGRIWLVVEAAATELSED
jgi:uncharacterized membrane protein HdeD (DUF308 family)